MTTVARGTLAFVGVVLTLTTLLTASFLVAEALGWTDERLFRDALLDLAAREHGRALAAAAVALLLAADLLLPVPSSVLMTLAGFVCGTIGGGLASFAGAMASAWLGFFACRKFGQPAFLRLIGDRDAEPLRRFMDRYGAWAILLSRPVPMLTEITSCVAGLTGMRPRRFTALAIAGTLPICFVYAWAGAEARGDASLAWPLFIGLVLPALGFLVLQIAERRRGPR